MDIRTDIEAFNKLHRDAIEKARQTNLDSDWNDAQSIEQSIKELAEVNKKYIDMGVRLGALEAFATSVFVMSPDIAAVNIFKQIEPAIYKSLIERFCANGHKPTGV